MHADDAAVVAGASRAEMHAAVEAELNLVGASDHFTVTRSLSIIA